MKPIAKTNYNISKLIFSLVFVSCITLVGAQNTIIIEINGSTNRSNSVMLNVTPPNQGSQDIPVNVGFSFPPGTKIRTSATTTLKLIANNNEQEIQPNTTHKIVRINSAEHTHKTSKGLSIHKVNNKTVDYKALGNKEYAISDNTKFSVEVDGNTESFTTITGKITTVEEIRLEVNQNTKNTASERNRPLTGLKSTSVPAGITKTFDANKTVKYYDTYDEALSAIKQELSNSIETGVDDVEYIANEYLLMGELYLDDGDINNAVSYFSTAINYFNSLEFRELSIAEGYLLMAEAYYMANYSDSVYKYANKAIRLVEPILHLDTLDYNYALEDSDYELMEDIAYDLFDEYDFLGWAYELLKMDVLAERYYRKADQYKDEYD